MSRKFIIRAIAFLMLYVAAVSYIFENEEKFFFDHEELEQDYKYKFSVPFKEMNIDISQDVQLHALWFPQAESKGMILYFPDGKYQSEEYSPQNNYFYQNGYDLLIPAYRGNGKSNSTFQSEEDIYNDAQQWYKMAHSLADSNCLIIIGRDFGSGVAAYISGINPADLVILENPYFSWNTIMLKKYFWMLPHSYLTQYEIPLWEFLRKSSNRIILVHAIDSKFISVENSHRLLEYLKPGDDLIELDSKEINHQNPGFQKSMIKIGYGL